MGSGTIRNPGMSLQPGFHGVDTMDGDNEGTYLHVLSYSPRTISTRHLGRMRPYKVSDQVGYDTIMFTNYKLITFQVQKLVIVLQYAGPVSTV